MRRTLERQFSESNVRAAVSGLLLWLLHGCHAAQPIAPRADSPPRQERHQSSLVSPPPSAPAGSDGSADQDYDSDTEAIGDEPDDADNGGETDATPRRPHPFDALNDSELARRLRDDPQALGSATLGRPNSGALFNAVQLDENAAWKRVDPTHAWATPETIEFLTKSLLAVANRYPGTEAVPIGHLSAQKGGHLSPHVSHQSGRDVDVGIYYSKEPYHWYKRATADNLDLERTWWLIRTLVLETKIEMILLDQSLSAPVERYALGIGEQSDWVEGIFHRRNGRPSIVRHASGHATHLHLRFHNPIAQESGRRLMPLLVARGIVTAPQRFVAYVARSGDTLAKVAARHSSTMQAIRQANGMKTYQLVAGRTYRIPIAR